MRPTEARIDLRALQHNYGVASARAAGAKLIAVVKADAYGHGAVPVARALAAAGCPRLATLSVAEAMELRSGDVALPILVLGGVNDADEAEAALAARTIPVAHRFEHLEWLGEAANRRRTPLPVQVEIDTAMSRGGVSREDAVELLVAVDQHPHLFLDGTFTHFARADEADLEPTREQLRCFHEIIASARARGVAPGSLHAANSAGVLAHEALGEAARGLTDARPGLMLYGANPAPHCDADLRPVMTLRTCIALVRRISDGTAVGYGATYRAKRERRIATLPIGYADGVPWSSGNRGSVLLRGRRLPIVGRVSMDYITVDLGEDPAEIGDEVIVFGEGLPVEEAAAAAETLAYELLVRVGARVPRIYSD